MSGWKKQLLLLVLLILAVILVRSSPLGSAITFENLKQNREALVAFVGGHYLLSVASFIAVLNFSLSDMAFSFAAGERLDAPFSGASGH